MLDLSPALRPRPVASEAHPRLHCETGRLLNSCSYSSARVALEAGAWRSALGVCSSIDSFVRIESVSLLLRRQFSEFCFKGDTTIDAQEVVAGVAAKELPELEAVASSEAVADGIGATRLCRPADAH